MRLAFDILVRIGENRYETQREKSAFDAGRQFREERIGQITDDHADKAGRRRTEVRGAAIIDVTEPLDRLFDARAGFSLDEIGAFEDERYGRFRYPGGAGYIDHRHRTSRARLVVAQRVPLPFAGRRQKPQLVLLERSYWARIALSSLRASH